MPELSSFKMPFKTRHFNQNQRVWVVQLSGSQAALCKGKFRGRGRYVEAWVNWDTACKQNPVLQTFDVAHEFAELIGRR